MLVINPAVNYNYFLPGYLPRLTASLHSLLTGIKSKNNKITIITPVSDITSTLYLITSKTKMQKMIYERETLLHHHGQSYCLSTSKDWSSHQWRHIISYNFFTIGVIALADYQLIIFNSQTDLFTCYSWYMIINPTIWRQIRCQPCHQTREFLWLWTILYTFS